MSENCVSFVVAVPTNDDRVKWLDARLRELEKNLIRARRQPDYVAYLQSVRNGQEPILVDDDEWDVMLPEEKKTALIPYYHAVRTELIEMRKKQERHPSMQNVQEWLESPWVRVTIALGTLAEVANLILHSFIAGGHFLNAVDENSVDPVLGGPSVES